jgi:hypothetical protein
MTVNELVEAAKLQGWFIHSDKNKWVGFAFCRSAVCRCVTLSKQKKAAPYYTYRYLYEVPKGTEVRKRFHTEVRKNNAVMEAELEELREVAPVLAFCP